MMKWVKKGLIYGPDGQFSWAKHSALQPTPYLVDDQTLRVFVGFRDDMGVSRIGFVDLDVDNPSLVLGISEEPALDIGIPGAFDENGVVPCAVLEREEKLYLYYAGYQLGQNVRFCVFAGLAISENGGKTFVRYSQAPIMDRTDEALLFRVIHSIIFEDGVWKAWYGGGGAYTTGTTRKLPIYDIRYIESRDGINFGKLGKICIALRDDEHRVGRPYVVKEEGVYKMFYAAATESMGYRLAYAESFNGIDWTRKDNEIGIDVSENGWDSETISYPSIVKNRGLVYLFYNGNNMGIDGFGYAVLAT